MAVKKAVTRDDIKTEKAEEGTPGENRVVAPDGSVTIVPDSIVDVLLESGYKRK